MSKSRVEPGPGDDSRGRGSLVESEDDTEGQRRVHGLGETEDDTEGHKRYSGLRETDEDTEGHPRAD